MVEEILVSDPVDAVVVLLLFDFGLVDSMVDWPAAPVPRKVILVDFAVRNFAVSLSTAMEAAALSLPGHLRQRWEWCLLLWLGRGGKVSRVSQVNPPNWVAPSLPLLT